MGALHRPLLRICIYCSLHCSTTSITPKNIHWQPICWLQLTMRLFTVTLILQLIFISVVLFQREFYSFWWNRHRNPTVVVPLLLHESRRLVTLCLIWKSIIYVGYREYILCTRNEAMLHHSGSTPHIFCNCCVTEKGDKKDDHIFLLLLTETEACSVCSRKA